MFNTDLGVELVSWLLVCCMVVMVIYGGVSVIKAVRHYNGVERECIDAGYAGYINFNDQTFCIGVVDGGWAVKLVEEMN